MKNKLTKFLNGVYCVSLPTDLERRGNAARELDGFGIERWSWHDGIFSASFEVMEAIFAGEIHFSPPCFRCSKDECACENNFLTFPQIAVCLVYRSLWERICRESRDESDLFLLCEDDVAFTERALEGAGYLAAVFERGELDRSQPLLVRLGWARGKEHESREAFALEADLVRMSNPCYLLNAAMAGSLLKSHGRISHTVDVFTHREENKKGGHFTLLPPIAYEHSWSTGRFESAIFPRKTRQEYLRKNASWGERIKMFFSGGPAQAAVGVRKRFEIHPGILVLESESDFDLVESRRHLPKEIAMAVWSDEDGWLREAGGHALAVPEWGVWYERVGVSSTLAGRFKRDIPEVLEFEKENLLDRGWGTKVPEGLRSDRLRRNATALLRMGCDSMEQELPAKSKFPSDITAE